MSCCSSSFRYLLFAALLFAAGCGPLPKPFKAENGGGVVSPYETSRDSAGVVVAPILGAPPAAAGPLADILVGKLAGRDIPATTAAALKDAYLLEGVADPVAGGTLTVRWILSDETGAVVDEFSTRHEIPEPDWRSGRAAPLEAVAAAAAATVAKTLQGPRIVARDVPETPPPGIAVVSVEGAPGDGNTALKTAFEAVLRQSGLPVVADPGRAAVRIFGKVDVAPAGDGRDDLSIAWTLRDPAGTEIGVLTQSNAVPGGRLEARWGTLAYDITNAMIDGIVQVLDVIDDAEAIRRR